MPKTFAKLSNRKPAEQKNDGQNYNCQLLRRPRPKAEKGPAVLKTACPRTNILVEIMCQIFADRNNKTCRNPCPACTCGKTEQSGSQRVWALCQAGHLENVQPVQKPNICSKVHCFSKSPIYNFKPGPKPSLAFSPLSFRPAPLAQNPMLAAALWF